jgi:2-haloalkanoic acid dehalogenase type II
VNFGDFDALSFDCYGTLIDWEAGISVHLERLVATYPELPDVATLLDVYGEEESVAERETPRALYPAILAASIRATAQRYGVSITNEEAAAFGASVPDWPAFPDSADALARLQRHYKLIILSNIDRASFAASNAKLGVTFDAILTAEDIGSYKPDPANFTALFDRIESMGIPKHRLLHVAQSLFHDHQPAKKLGMTTVWIDRRQGLPGAGATPDVELPAPPDATYPSMATFADAADEERSSRDDL